MQVCRLQVVAFTLIPVFRPVTDIEGHSHVFMTTSLMRAHCGFDTLRLDAFAFSLIPIHHRCYRGSVVAVVV